MQRVRDHAGRVEGYVHRVVRVRVSTSAIFRHHGAKKNARGSKHKMHEGASTKGKKGRLLEKRQNTTTPRVPRGSLTRY
jgi:hypothetical protein